MSLYRTRQALKLWYQHLSAKVKHHDIRKSKINDYLLLKDTANGDIYIFVYVDDILLFGETYNVNEAKVILNNHFTTTDLGICRYLFGIKI